MNSDQDLDLTTNEEVIDQIIVRVWRLSSFWWIIFLFPLALMLPYVRSIPVLTVFANLFLLWISSYLIRQRWRLTLTNKQIVARRLYPRPLTFLSRIHYFPLSKIEGLTIGPRAFGSILLLGVFISTNVGITLLKAGLSSQADISYDLPDTLDAVLIILRGITFLPFLSVVANGIEDAVISLFELTADVLVGLGITLIVLGIVTVLLTIPRRYHMQIRVRHGADFRLSAGIPRPFWEKCYHQLYDDEIVEAPPKYKSWRFPWLKDETVENSTDLEQIVYTNRFIGIVAIYVGFTRLWTRFLRGNLGEDVLLWGLVALTDIFIAVVAVVFSKKRNEMVVTNRRIIFAQEMQDLSGAFGRRLYEMSDIRRDDVAGFHIIKLQGLSYRYLILTILTLLATVVYWQDLVGLTPIATAFIRVVFVGLTLLFSTFIVQTYLEFNLQTKGGELWHMRHQLSNPLTMMRQLVGNDESVLFTTIMSNRLEEKEVVDTIQVIRAGDLGFEPKLSEDSKYFGNKYSINKKEGRQVVLDDLLLEGETIKFESNVSRKVPRRKFNLSIASFLLIVFSFPMLIPLTLTEETNYIPEEFIPLMVFIPLLIIIILVAALWIRYFSLFKARILFSDKRAFFIDIKRPPLLLYLLGISEEINITETLQDQIHSTYSSRQWTQQQYWKDVVYHGSRFFLYSFFYGLVTAVLTAIFVEEQQILDSYPALLSLLPLLIFLIIVFGATMGWHMGHLYIAVIRSLPKRVVHTQGIGSHFVVPFTSKKNADTISQTVWEGIITE